MVLIAEGDSALGGLALGRDYTKYGIMAIRGKIINALSNPDEKVYNNVHKKSIGASALQLSLWQMQVILRTTWISPISKNQVRFRSS